MKSKNKLQEYTLKDVTNKKILQRGKRTSLSFPVNICRKQ